MPTVRHDNALDAGASGRSRLVSFAIAREIVGDAIIGSRSDRHFLNVPISRRDRWNASIRR